MAPSVGQAEQGGARLRALLAGEHEQPARAVACTTRGVRTRLGRIEAAAGLTGDNCSERWRALLAARGAGMTAAMTTSRELPMSRWARQAATLLGTVRDDEQRDDLHLRFEERAAICEFDGKLPRAEAERVAHDELVATLAAAAAARRAPSVSS